MRAAVGGPVQREPAPTEAASSSHNITQSPTDPTQCVFQGQVWEWRGATWTRVKAADVSCT
eukprot:1328483-Lingulodinium_polyedra.AAC.1